MLIVAREGGGRCCSVFLEPLLCFVSHVVMGQEKQEQRVFSMEEEAVMPGQDDRVNREVMVLVVLVVMVMVILDNLLG